ncbi:MAG: hypothetical protein AUI14_12040 [Actinobacteria bacterium 13_2_20CM_2_71_6]|nr:MAG: hypothetical protein AUI14_12040 [Actinobacteria bacterium 13_2_20CM_2_71_6]
MERRKITEGDFIWVSPDLAAQAGMPKGCVMRIDDFVGPSGVDGQGAQRVYVRGPFFDNSGRAVQVVQVAVPVDCAVLDHQLPVRPPDRPVGHGECPRCSSSKPRTKAEAEAIAEASGGIFVSEECVAGLGWHMAVENTRPGPS